MQSKSLAKTFLSYCRFIENKHVNWMAARVLLDITKCYVMASLR